MSDKSLPGEGVIVIEGMTSDEKIQTFELADIPAGTVLQFQSSEGEDNETRNTETANNSSEIQYVNAEDIIFNTSLVGGESSSGVTYLFNQETGEIQLIDLKDATTIDSNEVEIVTVDGDNIFADFQNASSTLQIIDGSADSESHCTTADPLAEPRKAQKLSSKSEKASSISRLKNAPALLRNSRRVIGGEHAIGGSSRKVSVTEKSQVNSPPGEGKFTHSKAPNHLSSKFGPRKSKSKLDVKHGRQVVLVGGSNVVSQINHSLEAHENSAVENSSGEEAQSFYIYQNADGEQVAELVSNTYLNQTDSGVIYTLDHNNDAVILSDISSVSSVAKKVKKVANKSVKKTSKKIAATKTPKKGKGSGATELKCMEDGCPSVACNVSELRKHLTDCHDLSFDLERKEFQSDTAFKDWRQHYERDRMVSFIYRGGTKKISKEQSVTYMICHRSGHYKPTMEDTAKRKRKMKPQGTCKIGGYCTAGIKLLRNLENGAIFADICHTHYGHPLDSEAIPHLRVNPVLKRLIIKKFEEGLNFPDMLAYIHHNPDGLEGLRVIDRRAIRNIYDTWKKTVAPQKEDVSLDEVVTLSSDNFSNVPKNEAVTTDVKNPKWVAKLTKPVNQSETANGPKDFNTSSFERTQKTDHSPNFQGTDYKPANENFTEAFSENEMSEDESAPTLVAVTDNLDDSNESQDDETPPILIAIDSVKSLNSEEKAVFETQSKLRANGGSNRARKAFPDSDVKRDVTGCENVERDRKRRATATVEKDLNKKIRIAHQISTSSRNVKLENQDNPIPSIISSLSPNEEQVTDEEYLDSQQIKISPELEATIDKLHNHGEAGPSILLYKRIGDINTKYGGFCRAFREDDFCLIIQTPVQRQIFQLFPKIVSLEILDSPKPNEHGLKLAFISVLDDFREAIPIAWMIADSMCPRFLNQFFRMLRYHCGELPVLYIMAPRNVDIFKAWTTHFSHKPKMFQSEFTAKRDLRTLLNRHFPNDDVRSNAWKIVESLINEKQKEKLKIHKKKLEKISKRSATGSAYLKKMDKDWFSRITEWSFAYTIGIKANLLFAANSFIKLRKFVSFKGTKKLGQNIDHILKIGYDKCFLRTKRMFKGDQKLSNMLVKLDCSHNMAVKNLKDASVTQSQDGQAWKVKSHVGEDDGEGEVIAEVFHLQSPCDCKIRCKICNVCMHEYVCTCEDFLTHQTMCSHIHKVHCVINNISLEDKTPQESARLVDKDAENEFHSAEETSLEKNSVMCVDESTEVSVINENDTETLNITEVLGFIGDQADDGPMPDIISITDVGTQKVIYDASNTGQVTIFQLDPD